MTRVRNHASGRGPSSVRLFKERLLPASRQGGFRLDGYWIWCGSVTTGDDGLFHMFASRISKSLHFGMHWLTPSEIVHAVSPTPEGPYTFSDVALPARDPAFWDGRMTHNPAIVRHGGRYLVYYTATTFAAAPPTPEAPLQFSSPLFFEALVHQYIGLAAHAAEPGLVAHWNFNEGSGAVARDLTGHGHDAALTGTEWVPSPRGYALRFDAKDDAARYGNTAAMNMAGDLTLALWVRVDPTINADKCRLLIGDTGRAASAEAQPRGVMDGPPQRMASGSCSRRDHKETTHSHGHAS